MGVESNRVPVDDHLNGRGAGPHQEAKTGQEGQKNGRAQGPRRKVGGTQFDRAQDLGWIPLGGRWPAYTRNVAERVGFEPTEPFGSRALQARALDQTTLPL